MSPADLRSLRRHVQFSMVLWVAFGVAAMVHMLAPFVRGLRGTPGLDHLAAEVRAHEQAGCDVEALTDALDEASR